ncbi:MAG: hypothetical protein IJR88_02750 [Clostridia bacterium]|nr:hypothetical protein [Clostridia bacterium]
MKKSDVKWVVIGTVAAGLVAFSAGMAYALNKLKKINAEDLSPEDGEDAESEA